MAMDEEWVQVMMAKLWLLAFMDPGLEKWRLELLFEFFLFWQMYEQVFLARWMLRRPWKIRFWVGSACGNVKSCVVDHLFMHKYLWVGRSTKEVINEHIISINGSFMIAYKATEVFYRQP
jgi:hypothetical protein